MQKNDHAMTAGAVQKVFVIKEKIVIFVGDNC